MVVVGLAGSDIEDLTSLYDVEGCQYLSRLNRLDGLRVPTMRGLSWAGWWASGWPGPCQRVMGPGGGVAGSKDRLVGVANCGSRWDGLPAGSPTGGGIEGVAAIDRGVGVAGDWDDLLPEIYKPITPPACQEAVSSVIASHWRIWKWARSSCLPLVSKPAFFPSKLQPVSPQSHYP